MWVMSHVSWLLSRVTCVCCTRRVGREHAFAFAFAISITRTKCLNALWIQEKRMHQVAEQIARRLLQADAGDRGGHDSLPIGGKKTMLAKGIGIKGIAASLLSHEARKCRIAD